MFRSYEWKELWPLDKLAALSCRYVLHWMLIALTRSLQRGVDFCLIGG